MNRVGTRGTGAGIALLMIELSACGEQQKASTANANVGVAFSPPSFRMLRNSEGGAQETHYVMLADPQMPAEEYFRAAQMRCDRSPDCSIYAVTDPVHARDLVRPPSGRELAEVAYLYQSQAGYPQGLWNCAVFPQVGRDRCFKVTITGQSWEFTWPFPESPARPTNTVTDVEVTFNAQ